jgi:hypothetical protein
MASEHDKAIEKVLAALRTAAPPEGMQARIAQCMSERVAQPNAGAASQSVLRRLSLNSPFAAWWSGALTGAVVAILAVFTVLFVEHHSARNLLPQAATTQLAAPAPIPVNLPTSHPPQANPCPHSIGSHAYLPVASHANQRLVAESRSAHTPPPHPAPTSSLSPQERELVRLARLGVPQEFTSASPDALARLQEQEAAEFNKFFTPPPPPTTANNE